MVLFWAAQQALDCINDSGSILGKIKFDTAKDEFIFSPDSDSVELSSIEKSSIADRVSGLNSGQYSIPMQDDD